MKNNNKFWLIGGIITFVILIGLIVVGVIVKINENSAVNLTSEEQESMYLGDKEADKMAAEELARFPILRYIPFVVDEYGEKMTKYTHFEIRPEINNEKMTVLIKDYTGGNEQTAREIMASWDVDLGQYEIKYTDLSSEYGSVKVPDD
ncbi:hypothetical protein IJ114_01220 [Candidatus Saccharibacteria bacterium]|nr:hypothetical protein [Candidatus Saccharibacteria bacterium]